VQWFLKAAEQDYAEAQSSLGACYANGQGVAKDVVEAFAWFGLAARTSGMALESQNRLVAKEMSPEQFLAGSRRTRELRARLKAKMENTGK
jgi:hypothetical protein